MKELQNNLPIENSVDQGFVDDLVDQLKEGVRSKRIKEQHQETNDILENTEPVKENAELLKENIELSHENKDTFLQEEKEVSNSVSEDFQTIQNTDITQ